MPNSWTTDPMSSLFEGAATLAAELGAHAVDARSIFVSSDTLFLPVGIGLWFHQMAPRVRVVAVGVDHNNANSIPPSIDQTVHVKAEEIAEAQRALMRYEGLSVSAAGAAPLAGAMAARATLGESKVIVVVGSRALK